MKIALISFGYNKKSGVENVIDNMVRRIDRIDKENEYIIYMNKYVEGYYVNSPGISKKIVPMTNKRAFKTIWLLFIYPLVSLIERINITVVFSGVNNFSPSPFTKNVIYIHDLGELYIRGKYAKKKMLYRKYLALPMNKMMGDMFIAVSAATRNSIINKLKISRDKVKLIYNGTDEHIGKMDRNHARDQITSKYKTSNKNKIIIVIGRIDPVGKNLLRLIEAISIYKKNDNNFHLFLVGESNFPNSHLVPEKVEALGLKGHVTFTGYVNMNELSIFYNSADLLVFPSVHEGFGLPLLEAMRCEVPVACSDIDVFHEVAGEAAIYFDPLNASGMADSIRRVVSDDRIRLNCIGEGLKQAQKFSWESSVEQFLSVINSFKR
ncbi:MAG: glycosyltransferase family 4 protein [Nitrospirota bacterium]